MKTSTIVLCAFLGSVWAKGLAAEETVRIGANAEEVRASLGAPRGAMQVDGRVLLYYERGAVEFRDGRVIRVALRSADEHAAWLEQEERARTEREQMRARLVAEGVALRERKLADPNFLAAPAAYQVGFWEDFARRYPGVSNAEPLAIARHRLNQDLAEKSRRQDELRRLAEIEERLAAAEQQPVHYRVRTYPVYRGRHDHYREFGLGPITYTFFDAPLPAYTTPTTPLITPFVGDPAQPLRRDYIRVRRDQGRTDDWRDRPWRGSEHARDHRRGRM